MPSGGSPRGDVPEKHGRRLIAAAVALEAVKRERDAAIVDALKAGGSTHQVAAAVGMSQSAVHTIGKAGGWPTPQQRAEWDARKRLADEWRTQLEEAIAQLRDGPGITD